METRKLGRTSLQLTTIGLGTWALAGPRWLRGWGPQPEARSIEAMDAALELGVNWIDAAPLYGDGVAESLVGRVLEQRAERPLVATKCGVREVEGRIVVDFSADSIRREVEQSLRRLGADRIDLLFMHVTPSPEQLPRAWATLSSLRDEGLVTAIGASNIDADNLALLTQVARVDACQPAYSLLQRDIERDLLPLCIEEEIGVVAYSPQAAGLLTGSMTRERLARLPAGDWRARRDTAPYIEPMLSEGLAIAERLKPLAERLATTPGGIALAWVIAQPGITAAIVGARDRGQVADAVAATRVELPEDFSSVHERRC